MKFYLLELLEYRDMKQAELSRISGVRKNTINAYFHGYIKRLNVADLEKICDALDCKLSDLIEYIPNKK